ncbi:STP1 protein [Plasmodium ovale wallikeri]|uniref:STP1 protein n=1 Tax=Plasmodium ovale wallikeri TaxID=864142 RepID=A0A1A9ARE8_PLAOA|nr:STP1 protein [Plasmodium ovale wallikeri]
MFIITMYYSVIKMGDDSGYSIHTHYIDVEVFLNGIEGYIRSLIRKYGHKNCGLMHVELCDEIKNFINETKKLILRPMDREGKAKWNSEWGKKKNNFFNKLFQEEGFTYTCDSRKNIHNPSIYLLKSKHIEFCKERDVWKATVKKKNEFDECVKYNQWIEAQKKSFHQEYLNNVKEFRAPTVEKYFITKDHPGGHDPRGTYQNSKLNCTQYKPPPISHPQIPVAKAPTNKLQPPMAPTILPGSQAKDGNSVSDKDRESAKTKPEENIPPKSKTHAPDSHISSQSKTQRVGTSTVQDTPVKTEDPGSPVSKDDEKKGTTLKSEPPTKGPLTARDKAHPQDGILPPPLKDTSPTPDTQSIPAPTTTTSLFSTPNTVINTTSSQTPVTSPSLTINSYSSANSGLPSLPNQHPPPLLPATEGQDNASHSTQGISSDTHAFTHPTKNVPSTKTADSLLSPPQVPVLSASPAVTASEVLGAPESSSVSTITTTVTTTTSTTSTVTIPTMSIIQNPISSTNEAPGILRIPQPPTEAAPSRAEIIKPAIDLPHTPLSSSTPSKDKDTEPKSAANTLHKPKDAIQSSVVTLSKNTKQATEHSSNIFTPILQSMPQSTPHNIDQQISRNAVQNPFNIGVILSPSNKSGDTVKNSEVNTKTTSKDDITVRINKNGNPSIIPEGISPLTHIIPTLLVILGTLTLLFHLYKYTPFGFLLGRRRKRKKRDLRRTFVIPEKPTYESPKIAAHEWKDSKLVGKTVENDVYIKLLKINKYKQEMQKRKKKNKKTLIEVHMEVLEESKNNEWELHKGDFLEICLRGFINEENDTYSKLPNSELTVNNTNTDKTIDDIQKQEILWNNWVENHRNILEQWKKKEWFHILKNKWRNEEQKYKEKNDKLQENILNEQETHSIVSQKDIWKQWISKQATLIKIFNKEDWFKTLVDEQNKEKDNYAVNKYNENTTVTNINGSENENSCYKPYGRKKIKEKLMVQIHMMVLEECIKEDIMKNKEISIDNYIKNINNKNNYEQKSYIPECSSDGIDVPEFKEINTYVNE